jgi:hypothetical protein
MRIRKGVCVRQSPFASTTKNGALPFLQQSEGLLNRVLGANRLVPCFRSVARLPRRTSRTAQPGVLRNGSELLERVSRRFSSLGTPDRCRIAAP